MALAGNYLPEQHHAVSLEQLFGGNVRVSVARVDGVAVGCGGVAFYDGFAEVKRMYTRPTARRMGVAAGVLQRMNTKPGRRVTRFCGSDRQVSAEASASICARAFSDPMPSATTRA